MFISLWRKLGEEETMMISEGQRFKLSEDLIFRAEFVDEELYYNQKKK